MNPLRWPSFVSLVVCCAVGVLVPAAPANETDSLAGEAQEVLARHCRSCHSGSTARAGLNVFDRKQLSDRGLLEPAASELIELLQSGAMPPGKAKKVPNADREKLLEWLVAGAPAESPAAYVTRHLLNDWQQLPQRQKANARYVSLAHLAGTASATKMAAFRKDLALLMNHFSSAEKKTRGLEAIDPNDLVYRLDLEALGWDRRPFKERDAFNEDKRVRNEEKQSDVNLYDLLLLEYPYGSLSFSSPQFAGVRDYLAEAKPVRPVPYLRADWLVGQLATGELSDELALLLGVKGQRPEAPAGRRFQADPVTAQDARAEVGWNGDQARLVRILDDEKSLKGLEEKGVSRAAWEMAYPAVIRRLGVEKPILPLDGLDAVASLLQRPTSPLLKVETVDHLKNGAPKQKFEAGGKLAVEVSGKVDVTYELLWKDPSAYHCKFELAKWKVKNDKGKDSDPHQFGPIPLGLELGKEQLLVVAFPEETIPRQGNFPRGLLLSANQRDVRKRFVHPFYRLAAKGKGFDGPDVEEILTARCEFTIVAKER